MSNSGELGESGTSRKKRGRKYKSVGGSGGDIKIAGADKSQLLFESRLRSQETKDYKRVIRQHLDITTIEKKLEKGSYVSSSHSFYRDLKLLFTNAIVFYPPSSSESKAALELRALVSNEIKKQNGKLGNGVVKEEAESSGFNQKSSAPPLVACKKKSAASKKTSPTCSKQKDEKKSKEDSEEKTVTTTTTSSVARSSRRTSKGVDVVAKRGGGRKKQTDSKAESSTDDDEDDDEKEETPKSERKIASDKKKSVADFLKRIKKNSPQKGKETMSKDNQEKSDVNAKKETSKAKPRELRSNRTGTRKVEEENNSKKSAAKRKQPKKETEEVTTVTGKRGRESGKDSNKQQPKKRTRR